MATKKSSQGSALLLVILASVVLAVLARALTLSSTQRGFESLRYLQETRSRLVAESAISWTLEQLDQDPEFAEDQESIAMANMGGNFSLQFASAGAENVDLEQSVNNLEGLTAVDGPRGKKTVGAGTLDLVVLVEVDGASTRYEVLIRQPQSDTLNTALEGAGKIRLRGQLSVMGIESLLSEEEIPGSLHSSSQDPSARDLVSWSARDSDDRAVITGKVTTSSSSREAFEMGDAQIDEGTQTGVTTAQRSPPPIVSQVASHSSDSAFTPQLFGNALVGVGSHYSPGDVEINGDLDLQNGELYVEGNLRVNGSIKGKGTVWVTGDTLFRGDSDITTSSESGVSLLSHGNVELRGFSGGEYLETFIQDTGDPDLAKAWDDTKFAFRELETLIDGMPSEDFAIGRQGDNLTQPFRRVLGDSHSQGAAYAHLPTPAGRETNTLGTLRDALESASPSPTRDFMVRRLSLLQNFFEENLHKGGNGAGADPSGTISRLLAGEDDGLAFWDNISEGAPHVDAELRDQALIFLRNTVRQVSLDKVGSSSFNGSIVTDGAFLAEHDISVIGQVWATGANANATNLLSHSGVALEPGDVLLDDGSHLTYCHQYAEESKNKFGAGLWEAEVWFSAR